MIKAFTNLSNSKKDEQLEDKKSEYYCKICKLNISSRGNLQTHYQSKRHITSFENAIKNDEFYKKIKKISSNADPVIEKYKQFQLIKNDYSSVKTSLKSIGVQIPISLTSITNNKTYLCNGCETKFIEKEQYKLHINQCPQISDKYSLLKEITITLIVQLKQLQEACTNGIYVAGPKSTVKDKKIKILEEQIKELREQNTKLQCITDSFDSKRKKLKETKDKMAITNDKLHNLEIKYKILKKNFEGFKIQNNSNNNSNSNNKTNLQIIFANNPPFEYMNPFVNESTGMPTYPILPESKQALDDNFDQPTDIQAKLCNAMMFSKTYKRKKLLDFVSTAVINLYVKKNPSEQSIWSTDTTRNTYNVLLIDSETKRKFWAKDKEGITLKRILMQPIRLYLNDAMTTYRHYCTQKHLGNKTEFEYPASKETNDLYLKFMSSEQEVLDDLTDDQIISLTNLFCGIKELQEYICDPNFGKEVLRKMINKFYFDKTKCLAQCNSEEERTLLLQDLSKIEKIEEDESNEIIDEIIDNKFNTNRNEIIKKYEYLESDNYSDSSNSDSDSDSVSNSDSDSDTFVTPFKKVAFPGKYIKA